MKSTSHGSVLSAVIISVMLAGVLAGSVASLIKFQRTQGIRQQLKLHSLNAAEAAIDYAYSYIVNDAEQLGLDSSTYVPQKGGSPKSFTFPTTVLEFLQNGRDLPTTTGGAKDTIKLTEIKVVVMPRPSGGPVRVYKDPKDPANAHDPNKGQWVYQETIPVIASVTAVQGNVKYTSYTLKDINYNVTNLFQHSIFFQGQLHLHRGFKVMGSVHTNGNLILNAQNGDHAIYNGFVTAGNRFYRGSITDQGGTGMDAFGLVQQLPNGDLDPKKFSTGVTGTGSGETTTPLIDGDVPIYIKTNAAKQHIYRFVDRTTDSRMSNWKDTATSNFLGHLEDKSHSVPIVNPIGSLGYSQDVTSTTDVNEFSNGPYSLIEPVLPPTNSLRAAATSTKNNYRYNLSANASLILRVEYAARDSAGATVPDPNTTLGYLPTGTAGETALANALNPANYIVRAYKKVSTKARVNNPNDGTERIAIPFPTDVIGRADYRRAENSLNFSGSYAYVAGRDPQPIDILGTEAGVTTATAATTTTAAGLISPARVASDNTSLGTTAADRALRVENESWHRYRIESYYPVDTAARAGFYSTAFNAILQRGTDPATATYRIGTAVAPKSVPPAISATATATGAYPLYGLHDSRLGRGVHLLTLDISRLKQIMEEPFETVKAKFGPEAEAFRKNFNYNGAKEWNGIVYVEFPTTTEVDTSKINPAPSESVYAKNATRPWDPSYSDNTSLNLGSYLDSYLFKYSETAEVLHPLRTGPTDDTRKSRTDNVVPIAKGFREYPETVDSYTITNPKNAILALQVVHAKRLPKVDIVKVDANAQNTISAGFTLATNAPLYLIGSWNSDGDYTTGTNVTSTDPNAYAATDSGTGGNTDDEIPSAIFCDTLTVLSPGWATQTNYPNAPSGNNLTRRQNSFPGWKDDSKNYRTVTWKNDNERIEISACIATGEFPVFEFFTHALEDFNKSNTTPCTPIVVKGAMVGMFTSEIQHIKQAYGRDAAKDIQVYWTAHGAHAFPSPRLHKFILDGNFPPGTPQALVPSQSNFQILFKGDPLVTDAGL